MCPSPEARSRSYQMVAGAARVTVTATVAAPAGVEDLFSAVEGETAEEGEVLTLVAVVRRPTSP